MKSLDVLIRLHKFQVEESQNMIAGIESLIATTEEKADSLLALVEEEQRKTGIQDVSHFAFPMYARAAQMRRDNLLKTAEDLRQQIEEARAELQAAHTELKKYESLRDMREKSVRRQRRVRAQAASDESAARLSRH